MSSKPLTVESSTTGPKAPYLRIAERQEAAIFGTDEEVEWIRFKVAQALDFLQGMSDNNWVTCKAAGDTGLPLFILKDTSRLGLDSTRNNCINTNVEQDIQDGMYDGRRPFLCESDSSRKLIDVVLEINKVLVQ
ncbi:hypothetical protein WICPIJ_004094 [Wickerhamomyces pijperi]|uniref:Uncharacterized protein n=1 Tax=Wickerhamomyces pijperi TaxID=599730 RepID=A0A9P8Q6I2_WICPI|nr:hypothetical protein WICPIJ_004094 [Wickerhamomyces pijperi]